MTGKIAKSVKLSAIVALLVFMAIGLDEFYGDNQANADLEEFGQLLDGIDVVVFSNDLTEPISDNTQNIPVKEIFGQFAFLEAFDEVIRSL